MDRSRVERNRCRAGTLFFFSSRRRHTRSDRDWSSDVCSSDLKKGIRRPGDPHLRVKEMDRDGVDAEVIYGILAAAAKLNDREASNEMLRIYNTWLNDFCSHYPDRHIGLACLPYGDIEAAVAEVHRVAKLGFKGIELSCSWDMETMWHQQWEPLWAAINEVGIP